MKTAIPYILILSAVLTYQAPLCADVVYTRLNVPTAADMDRVQKLAEAGQAAAQRSLAELLYVGKIVKKDDVLAFKWAFVSVASGDKYARHLLKELELFVSLEAQKEGKAMGERYLSDRKKEAPANDLSGPDQK